MTELQYFKSRNEMPESRRKVGVIRSTQASVASESASIRRAKTELEKQRCMKMQEIERQQQAIDIDILYTLDSASLLVKLKSRIFQRLPPFE
jgi:hypothetical protein